VQENLPGIGTLLQVKDVLEGALTSGQDVVQIVRQLLEGGEPFSYV